jgi:hypothetical protein
VRDLVALVQLAAGRDPLTWETSTRPTRGHGPSCADLVQLAAGRATWCAVPGPRLALPGARPGGRPTRDQGRRPGTQARDPRALQRK